MHSGRVHYIRVVELGPVEAGRAIVKVQLLHPQVVCEHFEGVLKMMHLLTSLVAKLPNLSSEAKNTGMCATLIHRSLAFT